MESANNTDRGPRGASDPVYRSTIDGRWYFWDETWSDPLGPFKTEREARERLREYGRVLLNEMEE